MDNRKHCKLILCSLLTAALLLTGAAPAQAASSQEIREEIQELEKQQEQLQEKMEELEDKLTENFGQMQQTVSQKDTVDQQIQILSQQIQLNQEQIAVCSGLIADQQEQLEQAQEKLDALNEKYKDRIRAMEEEGELSYWAILFKANSFADLLDRLSMIQEIAAADQARLDQIRDAAKEVEAIQAALEGDKAALEQTRQEQQQKKQALDEKRAEADRLLQELVARGEEFEQLLEESEKRQEELMEQLAQKEEEYDEAKYREWLATYVPPVNQPQEQKPSQEVPKSDSDWLTPVPYYTLTSPFGMRLHPILGIMRPHNGVDMACPAMTPIYASRSGQVTVAAYQADGAGNYVQINHGDGFRSIYMHMTYYIVSEGQYVTAGQVIGYVGNTGLSKGNHLHFGISYNGTYVNPMAYLD